MDRPGEYIGRLTHRNRSPSPPPRYSVAKNRVCEGRHCDGYFWATPAGLAYSFAERQTEKSGHEDRPPLTMANHRCQDNHDVTAMFVCAVTSTATDLCNQESSMSPVLVAAGCTTQGVFCMTAKEPKGVGSAARP